MMQERFRKFGKLGLILATLYLPIITKDDGNAVDLDKLSDDVSSGKEIDASVFFSEKSMEKFNQRLRDVVIDMARLGYI